MSRMIEVAGVLRRVDYPPDPGIAERLGLVWRGRFVDEIDGEPVGSRVRIRSTTGLAAASAERGGEAGLVGVPAKAYPLLQANPVAIALSAEAEGYLPVDLADVVTAHPNHPAEFDPAEPPGPVEMQNLPVRLEGCVRRRDAADLLQPVAGATVALVGLWEHAPPAGTEPPADPAPVLEIRPPLTGAAAVGAQVRRVNLAVPGFDSVLAESAPRGATELVLESRAGIGPGNFLMIEAGHPDRLEVVRVASVAPLPPAPFRGRVTLGRPLAVEHLAGAPVSRRNITVAGTARALTRACIPGGVSLFVDSVGGLTVSGFLRIGTGAAQQIRRVRAYEATTDAEGNYRLPPVHRIARGFIDAGDGTSSVTDVPWVPRRDGPVDRMDLELPP